MYKRQDILTREENVYGEKLGPEELKNISDNFFETQHLKHLILQVINNKPTSLIKLSEKLNTPGEKVLDCLVQLKTEGLVETVGFESDYPVYLHRGGASE